MAIIPALRRLRQEELNFKSSLGYIVRPYPRKGDEGAGGVAQVVECTVLPPKKKRFMSQNIKVMTLNDICLSEDEMLLLLHIY
jgi:hypothetical protein